MAIISSSCCCVIGGDVYEVRLLAQMHRVTCLFVQIRQTHPIRAAFSRQRILAGIASKREFVARRCYHAMAKKSKCADDTVLLASS